MIPELDALLHEVEPSTEANLEVRLRFGLACAKRISHLLEHREVLECLASLENELNHDAGLHLLPSLIE